MYADVASGNISILLSLSNCKLFSWNTSRNYEKNTLTINTNTDTVTNSPQNCYSSSLLESFNSWETEHMQRIWQRVYLGHQSWVRTMVFELECVHDVLHKHWKTSLSFNSICRSSSNRRISEASIFCKHSHPVLVPCTDILFY